MSKFKVGDKVIRTCDPYLTLDVGTTCEIERCDGIDVWLKDRVGSCRCENFELMWQPEAGEMIDVTLNLGGSWFEKEFFAMDGDRYVFRSAGDPNRFTSCVHARQIKKTHTITLEDGTKVELSEESYKALQDSVSKI